MPKWEIHYQHPGEECVCDYVEASSASEALMLIHEAKGECTVHGILSPELQAMWNV